MCVSSVLSVLFYFVLFICISFRDVICFMIFILTFEENSLPFFSPVYEAILKFCIREYSFGTCLRMPTHLIQITTA